MKKNNNIPCVYKIIIDNDKFYIGGTIKYQARMMKHLSDLRNNKSHCIKLQRAYNKYGKEKMHFEIIEIVNDLSNLADREKFWIDYYNYIEEGLNIALDTKMPMLGRKHSKKTKELMSKNNAHTKGNLGKKFSEEIKEKISKSLKGRKSPHTSERMKEKWAKNRELKEAGLPYDRNSFYGRQHSEETKRKISEAQKVRLSKKQFLGE